MRNRRHNYSIAYKLFLILLILGPWLNHIVYCFQQKEYLLLIAGAIIVPVGWLHGIGLFFGWW